MSHPSANVAYLPEWVADYYIHNDTLVKRVDSTMPPYYALGQSMLDSLSGYRYGIVLSRNNTPTGLSRLYSTSDGWKTSSFVGAEFDGTGVLSAALIIDSNDLWISFYDASRKLKRIYHTTDQGSTWQEAVPFDTAGCRYCVYWEQVLVGIHPGELYALGGKINITDYAYTSDNGATWRNDSTFRMQLYRFAVTQRGLWGILGNSVGYPLEPYFTSEGRTFANRVVYSSNNGLSWSVDSATFLGDTLCEMFWLDKDHGWITSWRDSTCYVYRYIASSAEVSAAEPPDKLSVQVYPNPTEAALHIDFTLPEGTQYTIEIVNDLGGQLYKASPISNGRKVHRSFELAELHLAAGHYTCLVRTPFGNARSSIIFR